VFDNELSKFCPYYYEYIVGEALEDELWTFLYTYIAFLDVFAPLISVSANRKQNCAIFFIVYQNAYFSYTFLVDETRAKSARSVILYNIYFKKKYTT
jgi:hypothetical protein